ncbi:hypothetical protein EV2_019433 [Malus domestica]
MPCAVLAHAGEDFKPLELLAPYAVLAHAGEEHSALCSFNSCGRGAFDMASCHLRLFFGFVPFETLVRLRAL